MQIIKIARPVAEQFPISAPFGAVNPALWPDGPHKGTDFDCPKGTDVFCVADGHVYEVITNDRTFGNYILILSMDQEQGQFIHRYSHLSKIFVDTCQPKPIIKAGQLIAYSGDSGHVTGPHLDLALKSWPAWASIQPEFYATNKTERSDA